PVGPVWPERDRASFHSDIPAPGAPDVSGTDENGAEIRQCGDCSTADRDSSGSRAAATQAKGCGAKGGTQADTGGTGQAQPGTAAYLRESGEAKPVEPKKIDVKAPEVKPTFEVAKIEVKENGPKRPKEDVKVGNLGSGSAAVATVVAPVNKVQTGGFGDPNGLPGKSDPNHGANVNRLGSPALPNGEGYGNGTGGKEGIRGTVASTGFGNGTAIPPVSAAPKKNTVVAG